jgi:exosome complex RNA-binding protein Rrp4
MLLNCSPINVVRAGLNCVITYRAQSSSKAAGTVHWPAFVGFAGSSNPGKNVRFIPLRTKKYNPEMLDIVRGLI